MDNAMAAAQNLAAEFLNWLGSGLNPSLPSGAGIAFLVIAGTEASAHGQRVHCYASEGT